MAEFANDVPSPMECTQSFWNVFRDGDFHSVEDLLSPDCRIQDSFQSGRGINGIQASLDKLKELQGKLSSNGLLKNGMEDLQLMRNKTQCRFLIRGKVGFMSIVIGFAIEWQCNIITGFVLIKNASPSDFMTDNTIAPAQVSVEEEEVADESEHEESSATIEESTLTTSVSEEEATDAPTTQSEQTATSHSKKKEGWYPGKYWHETKPFKKKERKEAADSLAPMYPPPASSGILSRLQELEPPFLCPKPPKMNAFISVTVLGCTNLRSRMVRVVERPVNAYVRVEVGAKSRETVVCKRNRNPTFDDSDTFMFTLPETIRRNGGYIRFHVMDKNTFDEDILATKVVSLASLKCQVDDSDMPEIVYPLIHNERKFGKGLKGSIKSDSCTLRVRIAKIDLEEWWVLEELRLRDKATEERIAREKEEAKRKKAEEAETARLEEGVSEESVQWENDERVHNCRKCMVEFSITNRKHHCRCCGLVVCSKCSTARVVLKNGDTVRACDDCFAKRPGRRTSSAGTMSNAAQSIASTSTTKAKAAPMASPTAYSTIPKPPTPGANAGSATTTPGTTPIPSVRPAPATPERAKVSPPAAKASTHTLPSVRSPEKYELSTREATHRTSCEVDSDDDSDTDEAVAKATARVSLSAEEENANEDEDEDVDEDQYHSAEEQDVDEAAKGQRHLYDGTDTDDEDEEACVIS